MGNFVSFYNEEGCIPVRQNLKGKGLAEHFNRRRELYRLLGISPSALRNSDVLEFGPGSGDNAIFTDSLAPKCYKLVEGSKPGYQLLQKKVKLGHYSKSQEIQLELALIENYQDERLYDFVLCEGLLPGQKDPISILQKVASFVRPGGVLVVTTATYMSLLADIMRRMLFPLICDVTTPKTDKLVAFFRPHLETLQFASRLPEDWVMDSIVHPWGENYQFSLPEAVTALDGDFDAYGSSPLFFQNWQWYKEFVNPDNGINKDFIKQYNTMELSFLNKDEIVTCVEEGLVRATKSTLKDLYLCHRQFWASGSHTHWVEIQNKLGSIADLVEATNPATCAVLRDYITAVNRIMSGEPVEQVDFGKFKSFWGRGQQYLSLIRK